MKPVLALSTCWCSHRHADGYAMLQEMAALGFSHVELSHGIRIPLVPGILRALADGVVKVSSTHNFCPLPTGVSGAAPNLYEPSSLDERERDQWVRHTKRSVDFAAQIGARVVVCHLGRISFSWFNPAARLRRYLAKYPEAARQGDARLHALRQACFVKLRRKLPSHWAQVEGALGEVLQHAAGKGVLLAIENREKCEELPLDEELVSIFEQLAPGAPAGYWHDTGHAELKQRCGVLEQHAHLDKLARWTVGFHLHDVDSTGRDHSPVGSGSVDFGVISKFWKSSHLLTLELSPRVSAEDVQRSREKIEALLGQEN